MPAHGHPLAAPLESGCRLLVEAFGARLAFVIDRGGSLIATAGRAPGEQQPLARAAADRHGVMAVAVDRAEAFSELERLGHCTVATDDRAEWMHARALGRALVLVVLFAGEAQADPIREACGAIARALALDEPPPALPRN